MQQLRAFLPCALGAALSCSAPEQQPLAAEEQEPEPPNGQTGSIGRGFDAGYGLGCPASMTPLAPNTDTDLGFTAQTVIDLVSGAHRESLLWRPSTLVKSSVTGSSALDIDIEVAGTAHLLHREPSSDAAPVVGNPCLDAIGLPVRVRLRSEDGAFDESVETTLEAAFGDFARMAFALPLEALAGTYEAALPLAYGFSVTSETELAVQIGVTPLGVMGTLAASQGVLSPGGAAERAGDVVAHFPEQRYCENPRFVQQVYPSTVYLAPDQELRGVSLNGILAQLNQLSPVTARSLGGGASKTLSFEVASTLDHLCLPLEPLTYASPDELVATVRLSSGDGAVDGEFPAQIRLAGFPRPQSIMTVAFAMRSSAGSLSANARSLGILEDIDYTGYEGADAVFMNALEGGALTGKLEVFGRDLACNSTDSQAGSSCTSMERTRLWALDWGSAP